MGRYRVDPPGAVHIGDNDGLIALWLNEQSAYDMAALFPYPDVGGREILDAIAKAYPDPETEDES